MLAGMGLLLKRRLRRDRPHPLSVSYTADRASLDARASKKAGLSSERSVDEDRDRRRRDRGARGAALAVAEALLAEGAEVSFIGGTRAEAELVPAAGLAPVSAQGRRAQQVESIARRAGPVALALAAVPRARAILKRLSPDAVMGGGGYVAGPVGLAALTLRLPLVLTEADSHPGLDQPDAGAVLAPCLPCFPAHRKAVGRATG